MKKESNIHFIPKPTEAVPTHEVLASLATDTIKEMAVYARIRWGSYQAHKAEWFADEQALVLCQNMKL